MIDINNISEEEVDRLLYDVRRDLKTSYYTQMVLIPTMFTCIIFALTVIMPYSVLRYVFESIISTMVMRPVAYSIFGYIVYATVILAYVAVCSLSVIWFSKMWTHTINTVYWYLYDLRADYNKRAKTNNSKVMAWFKSYNKLLTDYQLETERIRDNKGKICLAYTVFVAIFCFVTVLQTLFSTVIHVIG